MQTLGSRDLMTNGLSVCVDWLSFTVMEICPDSVVDMMGFSLADFQILPRGKNGYKKQMVLPSLPVSVQYDGTEDMGIHVDISGSALSVVLEHYKSSRSSSTPFGTVARDTFELSYSVLVDFIRCVRSFGGHVARMDIAIDDNGAEYFTLADFSFLMSVDAYVSKFRKWKEFKTFENGKNCIGWTVYVGSRTSDIMLRVYDKQLEQNDKRRYSGVSPILTPWVRWELELKNERAQSVCDLMLSGCSFSKIVFGVLSNYLRLIVLDNERKSRCSTLLLWERFINGIEKQSLYCPPEAKTIDDTKRWLMRQCASSLALSVLADGGCVDFMEKLLESGKERLTSHHRQLLSD